MSASHPPIVERIETAIRDTTAERSPKRYDALMRDALAALTEAQQENARLRKVEAFHADCRAHMLENDLARMEAEAEVARLTAENAALKKEVQEAGEALRLLGVRLYNGAITPDDLAAMLKEGR